MRGGPREADTKTKEKARVGSEVWPRLGEGRTLASVEVVVLWLVFGLVGFSLFFYFFFPFGEEEKKKKKMMIIIKDKKAKKK